MINIVVFVAGVAAAGVWLRWAVVPVRIAYGLGRMSERQCARIRAGVVTALARHQEDPPRDEA